MVCIRSKAWWVVKVIGCWHGFNYSNIFRSDQREAKWLTNSIIPTSSVMVFRHLPTKCPWFHRSVHYNYLGLPLPLSLVMVFNATFNNISVISWWSVLLVKETRVSRENPPTCCKSPLCLVVMISWKSAECNDKHQPIRSNVNL
jgi:hypothetical protein